MSDDRLPRPPRPVRSPSRLFEPWRLGPVMLRNRVMHAAVTTRYAEAGRVTVRLIAHHVARARGGAALIVTEPMNLLPGQSTPHKVRVLDETNAAGLAAWATAVRAAGAHLVAQLQHPGRGRLLAPGGAASAVAAADAVAPSAIADDLSGLVPRALCTEEIEAMVADFAAAARRLRDAGFAGVEVSAGHGHLLHQFLAPRSNRRADRYGGDAAGRARVLTDLLQALREACGAEFLIGVKLPGDDGMPDGIDPTRAEAVTRLVHATGVPDYLVWCWGGHSQTLHRHLPTYLDPPAPYLEGTVALARAAPGIAAGALGSLRTPEEAERCVTEGGLDFVQLGRPLIADPGWVAKAATGRADEIRPCIACNVCWGGIAAGEPLDCTVTPTPLRAADGSAESRRCAATASRRVVVVGAGPAGLSAAIAAAERGHRVVVLGAGRHPARRLRAAASTPVAAGLAALADSLIRRAQRAGIEYRGGLHVEETTLRALSPEVVVWACGDGRMRAEGCAMPTAAHADGAADAVTTASPPVPLVMRQRLGEPGAQAFARLCADLATAIATGERVGGGI